jgi:hypothetical protein
VTVRGENEINEEVPSPPLPVCLASQTHLVLEEDTTLHTSVEEEPGGWRRSLVKLGIRKPENRCAVNDRDGKSKSLVDFRALPRCGTSHH